MKDIIRLVKFDIRGEEEENHFIKEEIELIDKTCNYIIPNAAPFFGDELTFKLYNSKGGELKLGRDYNFCGEFTPFCELSGKSVVSFIELSDEVLRENDSVFVTYVSIGAYFIPRSELEKWKESLNKGKIPIDFDAKVHSIPEVLPPSHHLHSVKEEITNWYDITYFYHNLYGLVKGKDRNLHSTINRAVDNAFELMVNYRNNEQAKLTKHDRDYDNPHSVTAKDIVLGNVPNIGVGSPEEIAKGGDNDKFLTTESLDLIIDTEPVDDPELMLPGVYPISKFGGEGFIPPSISGSFEGLGHENFSLVPMGIGNDAIYLTPRFDGKSRGLYYFKEEGGVVTPTYHKYDHPFFRSNSIVPTTIYNGSGKDVMMVYDKKGARFLIGNLGGSLNPEGHSWSFVTLPWGVGMSSTTVMRLGQWVYVFSAVGNSTNLDVESSVSFRVGRFLFDRIGKDLAINVEALEELNYTNADGDIKQNTETLELFKNVPNGNKTSKRCFFNFIGILPRNVSMNRYTSAVAKISSRGDNYNLRFLSSYWIEGLGRSVAGTVEVEFEHNPNNKKLFKLVGHSPKYDVVDCRRYSSPGNSPSPGWMVYGGSTVWFDEDNSTFNMGYSNANNIKRVKLGSPKAWLSENSNHRQATTVKVSLTNPLGFKPTMGSGVWGNGLMTFLALEDKSQTHFRGGFTFNEGFKIRPEVTNESVSELYSLPLPTKVKKLKLVNVPHRLSCNIAPLPEHTVNDKGQPSFGKLFASSGYVLAKGDFSLTLPSKTTVSEDEDNIIIEGVNNRTYTQPALEKILATLKGPKGSWKEYPEVYVSIYEIDGEIAEGKGELAKVPFVAVVDSFDTTNGVNSVVLFEIDQSKLSIDASDLNIKHTIDFLVGHSKTQTGGINTSRHKTQPFYFKVSSKDDGSYTLAIPTLQSRVTTGNGGLDGLIVYCKNANTTPTYTTTRAFWGGTATFHGDLGVGVSPSDSMTMESFKRRNVTGGCAIINNNFLFASTYLQEGWVVYFPVEEDVLINGSSYKLSIGTIDLRDVAPDPRDKTFYVYAGVEGNESYYFVSFVKEPRSVNRLLVGVVKTSKIGIETIDRLQPIHIGDRMISKYREGAILPISTGFPQDDGWFDHLDGEDLGIAKPGPEMPIPTGPVTKFDWRQEHGNVGEYSWTNPVLDYSVAKYVEAGYFEDDVQHYIEQGYDLSKYRLVISEWFTYVGQTGEPNNKTTHPLMTFVHDDIKKRFKTGFVKPRADYVKSDYLHIMDTYLPTRIERKDKSDVGIIVPHRIEDDEIKSKVSNYEVMTGIGPIANNFGEYFDVESKSLKNTDWWTSGVDFDFNRMVIKLSPFNSGGDGLNRENEFTKEYIALRTKLEKENKYLHEFYFKPQIPFQKPNPSKVVGMFAATNTQRYIDSPAPAPNGKKLPSIVVKPGNGLLSRGVSKGDLEKNIRGSWWEPILNNSVTDDRKFYDGKGYNPNTHDLHYYIWEDVTWDGSNTRDMYNHINTRKGKDRIRVDLNHFRQAQRYFATIVSLPKGGSNKLTLDTAYEFVGGEVLSEQEFNNLLTNAGMGPIQDDFNVYFNNQILKVSGGDLIKDIEGEFIELNLAVNTIKTRSGEGDVQSQRSKAYLEDYLPLRNKMVTDNKYLYEYWFDKEISYKGKTIGGVLVGVKVAEIIVDTTGVPKTVYGGSITADRGTEVVYKNGGCVGTHQRLGLRLIQNNWHKTTPTYLKWNNVPNGSLHRLRKMWADKKGVVGRDYIQVTRWTQHIPGGSDMTNSILNRGPFDLVMWDDSYQIWLGGWKTGHSPGFNVYQVRSIKSKHNPLPYEIQSGDVGTLDEVKELMKKIEVSSDDILTPNQVMGMCDSRRWRSLTIDGDWDDMFMDKLRQLKPVDWYDGSIDWSRNKLVFKVWTLQNLVENNPRDWNANRRNGYEQLYKPKRERLIKEHKYVFEHWFMLEHNFKGRPISGLFLTAHVERTAEPPQIFRYQFWEGSRYHKGHVDSCYNSNVVSNYGFNAFWECQITVHPPGVDLPPRGYVMAGLIEIPDNCHLVSSNITSGGHIYTTTRYAGAGKKTVEFQQIHPSRNRYLRIVIGNEIGERKEFVFRVG